MNASTRIFASRVDRRMMVVAASCLIVGACTSVQTASTGNSMAPEVAAISRAAKTYPSFSDIPPAPTDVRPLRAWGQAARGTEADRVALEQATADSTWTLSGTEAFAARAIADAGPVPASLTSTSAATEAYARELRRRATPPPPPKR